MNVSHENVEQLFIDFLTKHKLLDQFIHNYAKYKLSVDPDLNNPHSLLGSSFSWAKSPEGYHFWSAIYKEWKSYIDIYGVDHV